MATRLEDLVREQLLELGEDPARQGLERTPRRVADALTYLTSGYTMDPHAILNQAVFEEGYDEMVVVRDIARMRSLNAAISTSARPCVGSSRMRSLGFWAMPMAISRSRWWP